MKTSLAPRLALLALAGFVSPASFAADASTPETRRTANATLTTTFSDGRKTPADLEGLDILGTVTCDLDNPPPSVTPAQLKAIKAWRLIRLGEWNAKARAAGARGVPAEDIARRKISLHWTQVASGKNLASIVCHVSEDTGGVAPLNTIHTLNFADGDARPLVATDLLASDETLPALRTLLEKHKGEATRKFAGADDLLFLANRASVMGGTLTLTSSATPVPSPDDPATGTIGITLSPTLNPGRSGTLSVSLAGSGTSVEAGTAAENTARPDTGISSAKIRKSPEFSGHESAGTLSIGGPTDSAARPADETRNATLTSSGTLVISGVVESPSDAVIDPKTGAILASREKAAPRTITSGATLTPGYGPAQPAGNIAYASDTAKEIKLDKTPGNHAAGQLHLGSGTLTLTTAPLPAETEETDLGNIGAENLREIALGDDTAYFCFDQGVIAPAARGAIVIPVPLAELKPLLSARGRSLVDKR